MDDYPGAAAAYSLRLLNTDFTGDAIVVRRSSDNATQSIGFVDGELDVDTLNTFCSGANGFITTWYDQSGNGNNATNTTASSQPKIYDSVTGVSLENGKPSINFSVVNQTYLTSDFGTVYTQPNTIFTVFNKFNSSGFVYDGISIGIRNAQFSTRLFVGSNLDDALLLTDFNKQIVLSALYNTTNSFAYVNSNLNASGNVGSESMSGITIGNRLDFTAAYSGTMQEMIIYTTNETSNRTGIETNINNFYSIY